MKLRYGKITEYDDSSGLFKVSFNDDKITSDWMSLCLPFTKAATSSYPLDTNQQVACLMSENQVDGVILGSIYSSNDTPNNAGQDLFSITFDNGDRVKYNRQSGEMELKASGGVTINGDVMIDGQLDVSGSVDAGVDVTAGLTNTSLTLHTHEVTGVQTGTGIATSNPPL